MKVMLSLGSQAFQRELALTLAGRGMLARVLSFGLDAEILEPGGDAGLKLVRRYPHYRFASRVLWALWRRMPLTDRSRHFPIVLTTAYADWLMSRGMPACDVFHGWTSLSLAGLRAAKRFGAFTIIENPSMHPRDWQATVLQECQTWGLRPRDCRAVLPEALIKRMEREFVLADRIVVPSAIAARSFERDGLREKAVVVHAGIDVEFFKPKNSRKIQKTFRVCFAGRIELAKGVMYLLQAWKKLALRDAELILVGEVAPEMKVLLHHAPADVRFEGFLPTHRLMEVYHSADVFAFPSVNEGLARVLLEAMSTGMPVVATKSSGAEDCVTQGVDGTVVPDRDVDALAEALLWHYENRDATREMGRAARQKVEGEFTVPLYEERMMRIYRAAMESRS